MMLSTLTFLSTLIFGSSQAGLWSYKGDSSPEFWSEHFPICGGDSQSPIDLASDSASKTHTKNTAKVYLVSQQILDRNLEKKKKMNSPKIHESWFI